MQGKNGLTGRRLYYRIDGLLKKITRGNWYLHYTIMAKLFTLKIENVNPIHTTIANVDRIFVGVEDQSRVLGPSEEVEFVNRVVEKLRLSK